MLVKSDLRSDGTSTPPREKTGHVAGPRRLRSHARQRKKNLDSSLATLLASSERSDVARAIGLACVQLIKLSKNWHNKLVTPGGSAKESGDLRLRTKTGRVGGRKTNTNPSLLRIAAVWMESQ